MATKSPQSELPDHIQPCLGCGDDYVGGAAHTELLNSWRIPEMPPYDADYCRSCNIRLVHLAEEEQAMLIEAIRDEDHEHE